MFDRSLRARGTKVEASFAWRSGRRKRPRPCVRLSDLKGSEEAGRLWRLECALWTLRVRNILESFARPFVHANRLAKVPVRLERDERGAAWLVGRSGELRAVADWRTGDVDRDRALGAITSYLNNLHRIAAKQLRCEPSFECCTSDDALRLIQSDEAGTATSVVSVLGTEHPDAATVRTGWVDGPEVLDRFRGELARVEIHARVLARRLGTRHVTIDDLRVFGREGLLDAARSFDERHGVSFSHWATLRTRSAMIDGLRRWVACPSAWCARELERIVGAFRGAFSPRSRARPPLPQAAQARREAQWPSVPWRESRRRRRL